MWQNVTIKDCRRLFYLSHHQSVNGEKHHPSSWHGRHRGLMPPFAISPLPFSANVTKGITLFSSAKHGRNQDDDQTGKLCWLPILYVNERRVLTSSITQGGLEPVCRAPASDMGTWRPIVTSLPVKSGGDPHFSRALHQLSLINYEAITPALSKYSH